MSSTIVLQASETVTRLIAQGNADPSAVVNRILRQHMEKLIADGVYQPASSASDTPPASTLEALEQYVDESIPAAG